MLISGSCHCGNIAFRLDWDPEPAEIPARACTCTFCTRHGGVWTSCPTGSLEVRVRHPSCVSRYSFGTRTAEFHVCAICGVVPRLLSAWRRWRDHQATLNALRGLDARTLRDLGIDASELRSVAVELSGVSDPTRAHALMALRNLAV